MFYECFEVSEQETADKAIPDELAQAAKVSWERMKKAIIELA